MSRRKKHAHEGHVNHERWLVSYADLLTLLFAFFVVMYAEGHSDTPQVHRLTQAIMAAFSELGLFTPAQMQNQLRPEMSVGYQARQDRQDEAALASLRERMQTELAPQIHNHEVSMSLTREGLVIRVEEMGFFDSGSVQMRPEAATTLEQIAEALKPLPNEIRVQGYTDNVPIHTAQFASNWQLSSARAATIAQLLVDQYKLDPDRVSAAGFAEYHPIADNSTPAGRQQNRRVDIVVVSQTQPKMPVDTGSDAGSGADAGSGGGAGNSADTGIGAAAAAPAALAPGAATSGTAPPTEPLAGATAPPAASATSPAAGAAATAPVGNAVTPPITPATRPATPPPSVAPTGRGAREPAPTTSTAPSGRGAREPAPTAPAGRGGGGNLSPPAPDASPDSNGAATPAAKPPPPGGRGR